MLSKNLKKDGWFQLTWSVRVDIDRLRVMAYLPNAETELFFRQAMGRIVRSRGQLDDSWAYVIMPFHAKFVEYARRVRNEMSARYENHQARKNLSCVQYVRLKYQRQQYLCEYRLWL